MNEELDQDKLIKDALTYCVHNTPYSAYQYMRVIELTFKYGDKVEYHLTKKQIHMLLYLHNTIQGLKTADEVITQFLKEHKENEG